MLSIWYLLHRLLLKLCNALHRVGCGNTTLDNFSSKSNSVLGVAHHWFELTCER